MSKVSKSTGEIIPYQFLIRRRVQSKTSGISRTKQSFKDECDINNVLKHIAKGHPVSVLNGSYGDFTTAPNFQDALQIIIDANHQFASLPSKVRDRFHNDPALFLEFINDKENIDEAIKLGILEKVAPTPPPEPQKVIVVNPEASKA